MEINNYHKTEFSSVDGMVPRSGSITSSTTLTSPQSTERATRPYPAIVPVYTPVVAVPVVAEVPVVQPVYVAEQPVVNNGGATKREEQVAIKTTIFTLKPVNAGILVFGVLTVATLAYYKRDSIKALFK